MLHIIPTPIGNLKDITLRALDLLKELPIILCEDTRTTKKLLNLYEIPYSDKKFYALTTFTSTKELDSYKQLCKTQEVGLVCEAGSPGLSDPGKVFISQIAADHIPYEVLPGATALIPAVIASPTDTSAFTFLGFLPIKKGRQTLLKSLLTASHPVYFYESVHRIEKTCQQLQELGFEGTVFIARELTKLHEQKVSGTCEEICLKIKNKEIPLKGEFVVGVRNQ